MLALPLPLPLPKPKLPLPLKLPLKAPVLALPFPLPLPLPTPTLPLPLPLPLPIETADAVPVRADRTAAARMIFLMTFSLVCVEHPGQHKMTGTTQQGCLQKRRRNIRADQHGLSVFQLMCLSGKVEGIGKKLTGIKAYGRCILYGGTDFHAFSRRSVNGLRASGAA
ncbi:hypothetical protein EOD23_16960 [Mesorhizobium sp. USDA-HM6]|nr:hypothetical protein EOD23_16960 [Mesorhizobium sp. USDA-HM6]